MLAALPFALLLAATLAQAPGPSGADREVRLTPDHRILLGSQDRELSQLELFELAERPDLAARARANGVRRVALLAAAGGLAAATMSVGVVLLATVNLSPAKPGCPPDAYCPTIPGGLSNVCASCATGAVVLGAGLAASGILLMLGLQTPLDPLGPVELRQVIDRYNRTPGRPAAALQLLPWLSASGGGVMARATF